MKKLGLALVLACLGLAPAQAQNQTTVDLFGGSGAYNASPKTCTDGSWCSIQTDANGNLKVVTTGSPTDTQDVNIKQVQGAVPSATNPIWVAPATANVPWAVSLPTTPLIASGNGVMPAATAESAGATTEAVTAALASNLVVKASAGNLYGFQISADSTLSAAAWWIMIFDSTTLPGDGAVTPAKCYAMPLGSTGFSGSWPLPARFSTGIVIGVSTTGCFTKTASIHAFISGDYK